jgi:plastocyanin
MPGFRIVPTAVLLALIIGCGGGYSPAPSTPSPTPAPTPAPTPSATTAATITIQTSARTLGTAAFVPNPVNVSQGGVITWSNTDSTTHDMVSDTGVWDSGRIAPNGSFDFTFAAKGSYPYHCSIHPSMIGTVVVQ